MPHTQTIFHHLPDADMGAWQTYAWFTGWAALLGSGWYGSRHSSLLRFALVGGILVLLPSSSFAALQENMAEHRSHQFGFFFGLYLLTAMWKFHDRYLWRGVVATHPGSLLPNLSPIHGPVKFVSGKKQPGEPRFRKADMDSVMHTDLPNNWAFSQHCNLYSY